MYAIIETGGKQYRVQEGEKVRVEKLPAEAGGEIVFDRVLLISKDGDVKIGSPVVDGAVVTGVVDKQGRGKKIIVYKYKAKKNYRRKNGHRQAFTQVLISSIKA